MVGTRHISEYVIDKGKDDVFTRWLTFHCYVSSDLCGVVRSIDVVVKGDMQYERRNGQ